MGQSLDRHWTQADPHPLSTPHSFQILSFSLLISSSVVPACLCLKVSCVFLTDVRKAGLLLRTLRPPFEPRLLPPTWLDEPHLFSSLKPLFATSPASVCLLKEPYSHLLVGVKHPPPLKTPPPLYYPHPSRLSSPEERTTFREAVEQPSLPTHVKRPEEEEEGHSQSEGEKYCGQR